MCDKIAYYFPIVGARSIMANTSSTLDIVAIKIEEVELMDPASARGIEWERLVGENDQSGFMQSLRWGRFKQASGQIVFQIIIEQGGKIIAGCLLYTSPDPEEKKPVILAAPYGPVIPWQDERLAATCLRLILKKAEEIAQRLNAVLLRIEPRLPRPVPRIMREFGSSVVNHVPAETLLLDLRKSPDLLLADMKAKCRYNISLARKHGVEVREEQGREAAVILYKMLMQASERDDFLIEPNIFFKSLLGELQASGMARLFVAEHDGAVLGAMLMIVHEKKATYLYGGVSNENRHMMAGYALQWHAIRDAQISGCESYDFYGYDQFMSPSNQYARFSRFKSGFGGDPVRFVGGQDYVFMDKLVDNVIDFFRDIRC